MFPTWLKLEAFLLHHWEISRMTNEDIEGIVFLIKSPKRHRVGMEVKGKSQTVPLAYFRLNFGLHGCGITLQFLHQSLVR